MCNVDECCTEPRDAHTRLVVLERGVYMSYPATKVLLQLVTGRRHQIRVHCSTIGHTIVGDYTYSGRKDTSPHRTFLHSYRWVVGVQWTVNTDPTESLENCRVTWRQKILTLAWDYLTFSIKFWICVLYSRLIVWLLTTELKHTQITIFLEIRVRYGAIQTRSGLSGVFTGKDMGDRSSPWPGN